RIGFDEPGLYLCKRLTAEVTPLRSCCNNSLACLRSCSSEGRTGSLDMMISFRFCPCPQGGPKEDRDFGNTVQVGSALSADGMRPVARKYGNRVKALVQIGC